MNNYAYEILYPAPLALLLFSLFFTCFLFSIFYQSLFFTAINCQSMQFSCVCLLLCVRIYCCCGCFFSSLQFSIKFANNAHSVLLSFWCLFLLSLYQAKKWKSYELLGNAMVCICRTKTFAQDELIQFIIYLSVWMAFKQDVIRWIAKWQLLAQMK